MSEDAHVVELGPLQLGLTLDDSWHDVELDGVDVGTLQTRPKASGMIVTPSGERHLVREGAWLLMLSARDYLAQPVGAVTLHYSVQAALGYVHAHAEAILEATEHWAAEVDE